MKKAFILIALAFGLTNMASASQTSWGNGTEILDWLGVQIPDSSSWIIRIYESTDNAVNFSSGSPTSDDLWTGIEFSWNSGGAPGYCFDVLFNIDTTYNLAQSDKCYSIIFNSDSYSTATKYAVIDDGVSVVNYVGGDFAYDAGGTIAGNWQAVPEPATFLLFGMGAAGAWLVRRNKLKAREEA